MVKATAEGPTWNRDKGELTILGRRHSAFDIQPFCNYMDQLVGEKVAEVMMKNLQLRLGKEDGAWLKKEHPKANLIELINLASEWDRLAGYGSTKASVNDYNSISLTVSNPAIKGTKGAAKAFLFAWWAGVIGSFIEKDCDYSNVAYDQTANTMECEVGPRVPVQMR